MSVMARPPARVAGFTLVGVLFVLVVAGLLGAYMVQIGSAGHLGSALTVQGLRARLAAHSGLEWTRAVLREQDRCPDAAPTPIDGFRVRLLRCRAWPVEEGARRFRIYELEVVAETGGFGTTDHVARRLRATLEVRP